MWKAMNDSKDEKKRLFHLVSVYVNCPDCLISLIEKSSPCSLLLMMLPDRYVSFLPFSIPCAVLGYHVHTKALKANAKAPKSESRTKDNTRDSKSNCLPVARTRYDAKVDEQ
jgi:hypothetical protein